MARSRNGEAIRPERRSRSERGRLRVLLAQAKKRGELQTWRRAKAVLGYLSGSRVIDLAEELDVTRGSVNRWLQWFNAEGTEGLKPRKAPGPEPRLSEEQLSELTTIIEAGPQSAGYLSGVWTGPMIGDLIRRRYGVKYHNHYIPPLLHKLGFSVQRPRKRLARADHDRQEYWLRTTFPRIKKKPLPVVV
jgi:transposase